MKVRTVQCKDAFRAVEFIIRIESLDELRNFKTHLGNRSGNTFMLYSEVKKELSKYENN
jgi:hypothetical protein